MKAFSRAWILGVCCFVASACPAQLIVSAHDGKQVRPGDALPGPFPDEVVTLRLDGKGKPVVVGRVNAAATLNGPPVSIAVAPTGRFALVASSQRFGADNKLQPYGVVSMIDLRRPESPEVVQALEVPGGAMGVALSGDMKTALVVSSADESVSVLSVVPGKSLRLVETIKLEPKSEPRDVVLAPDGRTAYVVRFGDGKITPFAVRGTKLTRLADIIVGIQPDGAIITHDGRYLYNTNFGGTSLSGSVGAISTVDLRANRMVAAIEVGQTPEHVALSPDGRLLVSVVGNGSAFNRLAANYATVVGRLRVYRASGSSLVQLAEAPIGHNCQGATFSDDDRFILVQCAVEKSITVFGFDGTTLVPVAGGELLFDARPGAIATARSR